MSACVSTQKLGRPGIHFLDDFYWYPQLNGRVLDEYLECSNLVDSDCQLVATPGGGGVGQLICGGGPG